MGFNSAFKGLMGTGSLGVRRQGHALFSLFLNFVFGCSVGKDPETRREQN
jgi:hypothetical protein